MGMNGMLKALKGGIIVSCQAYEGEPLYGADIMARLAIAAKEGGAVGIRANSPADVRAIKQAVSLPVIGIWKAQYEGSDVYITPTMKEAAAVAEAGADIIALDATSRPRPHGEQLEEMVKRLKKEYGCLLMADVSTVEEGLQAEAIGFDMISTTLSGYTSYTHKQEGPDLKLVQELAVQLSVPVLAEGRIGTPDEAMQCVRHGAYAIVVGGAITRPEYITKKFVDALGAAVATGADDGHAVPGGHHS
ncbi:N-acetylmannosamine-6-phosphate 2-epimerase [Paenibacillus sp. J5C_2022]|nr:N-acetylmannosamine-6-phosphate 2-epimerase [Paenibacillus sp. J5C2022]MCU6711797.1 N-acetylmannosamine-6-phosphate 2-epimerase [Paenibacillus sp. J5C2022]